MATFRVDDVTPATEALPTCPLGDLFPDALAVGGDPALPVLEPDGVHPLLSAVARAFADHRPLVLSPDAVWLTIAQGLAQHIRLHAEELRPLLVSHTGRKRLTVTILGSMPQDANSWQDLVEEFHELLAAEVSDAELFECDFSTSTDVERIAGRVVMLDAYSPYFSRWAMCICGIPSITLTGTAEDWRRIRARVDALAGFGLQTWRRSLVPITDQFARAAAGDVDTAFWQRIYNPVDAYGGDVTTGWAARLYPYLSWGGVYDEPNPLLELPIDEPRGITVGGSAYNGPGIRSDRVPSTLSRVIVNVNDRIEGDNRTVALHAGLVGVAQDGDGALRPVAGWHLAPAAVEIDDVIDRIMRDHPVTPPEPAYLDDASEDLVTLYCRIGSASLFGGAWQVRPYAGHGWVIREDDEKLITTVIDLADGRSIGWVADTVTRTSHWVVYRVKEVVTEHPNGRLHRDFSLADDPADIPVLGTSLALLLDAALDSGGDIAHLETGRLDRLDAALG